MAEFKVNPKITLAVECRDKDGNLLWSDGTIIPLAQVEEQKEADNGRSSDDRGEER
jgi:hypothetical protein